MNETVPAALHTTAGIPIPLLGVRGEVLVNDVLTRVTLEHRYVNREDEPVEAVYTFPVPGDAALYSLEVRLGEQVLVAQAAEAQAAEARYEAAVEEAKAAVMLQQPEPGLYTLSFANLPAGEEASVRVVYAMAHRWIGDALRVRVPTVIAQRYGHSPLQPHQAPVTSFTAEHAFDFTVRLQGALADMPLACPTHALSLRPGAGGEVFALSEAKAFLDRDLVLTFRRPAGFAGGRALIAGAAPVGTASGRGHTGGEEQRADGENTPRGRAARDASQQGEAAAGVDESAGRTTTRHFDGGNPAEQHLHAHQTVAMLAFTPRHGGGTEPAARSVTLVVDCSGSMGGTSIEQARSAIRTILDALDGNDVFNIIRFGSHAEPLFERPVPASAHHRDIARRAVRRMEADLGGTAPAPALELAWQSAAPAGLQDEILFVTDGHIAGWEPLVERAREAGRRVFAVGVGLAASEGFLSALARETGGAVEYVTPGEDVSAVIERQFHRVRQPRAHAISVTWPSQPARTGGLLNGSTFDGDTLLLSAWFDEALPGGEVVVDVRWEDGTSVEHAIALDSPAGIAPGELATLAAKQRIAETPRDEEARALALYYGLPTRHTYLFLAAPLAAGVGSDMPALRRVPQMHAHGWGGIGSADTTGTISFAVPARGGSRPATWSDASFDADGAWFAPQSWRGARKPASPGHDGFHARPGKTRRSKSRSGGRAGRATVDGASSPSAPSGAVREISRAAAAALGTRTGGQSDASEPGWSLRVLELVVACQYLEARWLEWFVSLEGEPGTPIDVFSDRLGELPVPALVVQELLELAARRRRTTCEQLGSFLEDFLREVYRVHRHRLPQALMRGSWRTRGRDVAAVIARHETTASAAARASTPEPSGP